MTILNQYYTEAVLDDDYRMSESGTYYAPQQGSLEEMMVYIRGLPMEEQPEEGEEPSRVRLPVPRGAWPPAARQSDACARERDRARRVAHDVGADARRRVHDHSGAGHLPRALQGRAA